MSDDDTLADLASGPATDSVTDAVLDSLELLPPAHTDQGNPGHDLARASARRTKAVRLRMSGATYDQIAKQCGYTDKSTARKAVMRSLVAVEAESVSELRLLENARLDSDEMVLRTIIANGSNKAADRIRAIDSRLRLAARRARLNGLDAPIQVALSAGISADLDDALTELAELTDRIVPGEVTDVSDEPMEA